MLEIVRISENGDMVEVIKVTTLKLAILTSSKPPPARIFSQAAERLADEVRPSNSVASVV